MNNKLKRLSAYVLDNWQVALVVLGGTVIASGLLLVQLGSLVNGLSADEFVIQQQVVHDQITVESLLRNPLYLPYYLALFLLQLTPFSDPAAVRSVGATFGLAGALGFFYLMNSWYTTRIAFLGTALFATSSWFLHTARYASPDASYLLLPVVIAGAVALQHKSRSKMAILIVMLLGILTLYIPGMIWLLIPAIVLQRRTIITALGVQSAGFNIAVGVLSVVLLIPLITVIVTQLSESGSPETLLSLAGLPSSMPTLTEFGNTLWGSLGNIFAYSSAGPLYAPGHMPWFDIATTALLFIGLVQFGRHYKLDRSKLAAIIIVFGLALVAVGGGISLVVLLPVFYLQVVEGLKWLLGTWLTVFPRNPFARSLGIIAVVVLVACIGAYQTNRYFLAWGQAPETQAVFNQ